MGWGISDPGGPDIPIWLNGNEEVVASPDPASKAIRTLVGLSVFVVANLGLATTMIATEGGGMT